MTTSDTDVVTAALDTSASGAAVEDTPRPLRKDAARNRALLIAAAREVFAERGLEASLDDVAHRAGVGVGTAYRHFANKYDLAKAIFAEAIEGLLTMAEGAQAAADPWLGIVEFLEGAAAMQTVDRGLREVLMGVHDPEHLKAVNDRLTGPLHELVTRAKATGAVRADLAASDVGIVVMMLCTVADVTGEVAPDQWRRYLPMLLAGLRPGVESPVGPLDEDVLREAMSSHKQRLFRARSDG